LAAADAITILRIQRNLAKGGRIGKAEDVYREFGSRSDRPWNQILSKNACPY
jgi:hypothetical protein